jgi:hypothetical protein
MPYKTIWQANGIVWTYSGVLTGNELLNSNFEIFGDERFDDLRYQIVDLTAVEKIEVARSHVRKIAHLDMAASRSNPRIKVAIVTTAPDGQFISDIYKQYTEGKSPWVTKIFTAMDEAMQWAQAE